MLYHTSGGSLHTPTASQLGNVHVIMEMLLTKTVHYRDIEDRLVAVIDQLKNKSCLKFVSS